MIDKEKINFYIKKWKISPIREHIINAEKYYKGKHDILKRERTAIGNDGKPEAVENLPNNKIVFNLYSKIVDQKTNYLFGKQTVFQSADKNYNDRLAEIFDKKFMRTFTALARNSINSGIAWLHPYYDEEGMLRFKRIPASELCPIWADAEHTKLEMGIRIYTVDVYEMGQERTVEMVEVYTKDGVERFRYENGMFLEEEKSPYVITYTQRGDGSVVAQSFNWERVPLIAFKSNTMEIPLLNRVKSLQDGINTMLSDFENSMQEDSGSSILILKNYDGENLGEFRKNLATYRAVKVRSMEGGDGGLDSLQVEVNAASYESILKVLKDSMFEAANAFDAKDDRMGASPNEMNLRSMYSDIDLDANGTELEYKASLDDLFWFVDAHLFRIGAGKYFDVPIDVIFNRDMIVNEAGVIENCKNSVGIISKETIVKNHPWVEDVDEEMKKVDEEESAQDTTYNMFNTLTAPNRQVLDDGEE